MTITYGNAKPFSPTEAIKESETRIPDFVFDAVNTLLGKYAANRRWFTISKTEIIEEIISRAPEVTEDMLYKNHWLDFEPAYQAEGWKCHYESPDWGSSASGYYEFEAKVVVPQPAR